MTGQSFDPLPVRRVVGRAGDLDLHFQLTPGPAVIDPATKTARTDLRDGSNVRVWAAPDAAVTLEAEEAWFTPKWFAKEPLPAFRYRL